MSEQTTEQPISYHYYQCSYCNYDEVLAAQYRARYCLPCARDRKIMSRMVCRLATFDDLPKGPDAREPA